MIKYMLLAGCGGFIGCCGRFLVGRWCACMWHGDFPLGTFLVNITGCFIIGLFLGLLEKTEVLTSAHSALLVTGFCGGFTTFSAFADDLFRLGERGNWGILTFYMVLSVITGILLVWAGRALIR